MSPIRLTTSQTIRLERSDDGGLVWRQVIDRARPGAYQDIVARDREAPFGIDVLYRAFTDVDLGAGARLSSQAGPVAVVRVDSETWAVRDPADPDGEFPALVTDRSEKQQDASTVHRPAGRHVSRQRVARALQSSRRRIARTPSNGARMRYVCMRTPASP